jgi:hypothetical protein
MQLDGPMVQVGLTSHQYLHQIEQDMSLVLDPLLVPFIFLLILPTLPAMG